MNVKEEKWRLQDNDRMRQYFNFKFGQDNEDRVGPQGGLGAVEVGKAFGQSGRPHTSGGAHGPGGGFGGGFGKGHADRPAHESLHEQREKEYNDKIAKLEDELEYKASIIAKMTQWKDFDAHLAGGEDGMREIIENERVKFQAVHHQESSEMADAAQ